MIDQRKNKLLNVSKNKDEIIFTQVSERSGNSTIIIIRDNENGYQVLSSTNLINCVDCGHYLSTRAVLCPHCGCPLSNCLEEYFDKFLSYHASQKEQQVKIYKLISKILIQKQKQKVIEQAKEQRRQSILKRLSQIKTALNEPIDNMSLERLEIVMKKYENNLLRKEARSFILQNFVDYLRTNNIEIDDYPTETLVDIGLHCLENKLKYINQINQISLCSKNEFNRIASSVIPRKDAQSEIAWKNHLSNVWNCYQRFLVIPDQYKNKAITVGFVSTDELIEENYILEIINKIHAEINTIRRSRIFFINNNENEYEKMYIEYLQLLKLTQYADRKKIIEDFSAYKVIKSAIPQWRNKSIVDFCKITQKSLYKQEILARIVKDTVRIHIEDVVVASSDGLCSKKHKTKLVEAKVMIELKSGTFVDKIYLMQYCEQCNVYYITDDVFRDLIKQGIVLCKIYPEEIICNGKPNLSNWNAQSLLNKCGYNVNAYTGLSDEERQDILASVYRNGIYSLEGLIEHISWLISINKGAVQKNMEEAISKWEKDKMFLLTQKYRR